MVGVGGAIS
jgi:hypothetical protein